MRCGRSVPCGERPSRRERDCRDDSGRHALARLLTPSALVGALPHRLVVSGHALAVLGARAADLRAHPADPGMHVRATEHEIGAGVADISTIQQEPDVRRLGMSATEFETMIRGGETGRMTLETLVDAFLHLAGYRCRSLVCHESGSFSYAQGRDT